MSVVLNRPYEFVPPHRGNGWPSFIQTFRIVDFFLKRKEGVVGYECRGLDHWKSSLDRGDGILLAPNHCRYADPLVLGWPSRELKSHVHAMASWHLFNKSRIDTFAIRRMGGFSVNREGSDRTSLETAIEILATAKRPLILFPEGTTNRTNDVLKPLLDGVAFIARSAAKRRQKDGGGNVVMHPVALKYLCVGDIGPWADQQLRRLEDRLGWSRPVGQTILQRTVRLAEGLLALKEIEYFGHSQSGDLPARRDALIQHVLGQSERRLGRDPESDDVRSRVRAIRTEVVTRHFAEWNEHRSNENRSNEQKLNEPKLNEQRLEVDHSRHSRWIADAQAADLAQDLLSYPNCYLETDQVTDTRIVETIQRMQETFFGRADVGAPLKVIIQCDAAIPVSVEKPPRGQPDPMMTELKTRLTVMLESLSAEARLATQCGLA